jgi:hypothetical protein
MFIFVIQTLQKKWNEICMKQLADGKHMENNCFLRTLKFEMYTYNVETKFICLFKGTYLASLQHIIHMEVVKFQGAFCTKII